ncbi:MAG: RNA methyltransferase, partial [Oscillatoriales cyanobacterium RM2_1_1]|nr:RNA methyltransferase [Oscillatoriales cyanobacterium RM2_1_1]
SMPLDFTRNRHDVRHPQALQGCQRAIATTARSRALGNPLEHPRQAFPWLLNYPAALIFGPEDRGLSNQELNYAQRFVQIPSSPIYPTLNLAQAIAVSCYELYQLAHPIPIESIESDLPQPSQNPTDAVFPEEIPVTLDHLEEYYQQLESVLLRIGYLHPHTAKSRMEKFRRLFNRANLSTSELAMLRGILSQVKWAVDQPSSPNSVYDTLKPSSSF